MLKWLCVCMHNCQCSSDSFTLAVSMVLTWLRNSLYVVSDTCYVLSFAVIMLNTSLHNPAVKDKPTVDRFVAMNRGINEGGDLPRELLEVCVTLLEGLSYLLLS